ncbi:MAG: ABC transporter ATP-binding protein [Geminicoccaceae bacterium]
MSDDKLVADGISVEFAGLRALDRVSLSLASGDILGLIGPNGSGKTTLVNAITGQVPLVGGRVMIGDVDLTGRPPHDVALAGIARTFQIGRHFEGLTVQEGVAAAALAKGQGMSAGRRKAAALLDEFGLAGHADSLAGTLSYGDKRRLEVARALAGDPAFLLLDEPAAGMNDAETGALLDLLMELPKARGLGLLIIDHDMSLIMRLCRRLHVLASGKTIAEGDRETVRHDPAVIEAYLGREAVGA